MKILDLYMRGIFYSVNLRKLHIYTIQTTDGKDSRNDNQDSLNDSLESLKR